MAFLIALAACAATTPLVIRLSPRLGLMDRPGSDPLKVHDRPVPRGGGVAVAIGLLAGGLLVKPSLGLVLGGLAMLGLGLLDDLFSLSPSFRLASEAAIALATGYLLLGTGSWAKLLIATATILVAVNAANLFDGLDGVLALTGVLTAAGLSALGSESAAALWLLAGALLGLLAFNRPPARIFLGDGGAYLVGFVLGVGLVGLMDRPVRFVSGVLAFGLIGVDLVWTVLRRWRSHRPLFAGDRDHLYDRLVQRGLSPWRLLLVVGGIQAGFVALALLPLALR